MSETDDSDLNSTTSSNDTNSGRDTSSSSSTNGSEETHSLESGEILDGIVGEDDDILDAQENLPNGYVLNANSHVNGIVLEIVQDENEPEPNISIPIHNLIREDGFDDISLSSLSDSSMITVSSNADSTNNLMSSDGNTDPNETSTDPSSLTVSPRYEPPEEYHITPRDDDDVFQRPQAPAASLNTTASEPDLDVLSLTCSSLSSMSSYFPSDGSNGSPHDFRK